MSTSTRPVAAGAGQTATGGGNPSLTFADLAERWLAEITTSRTADYAALAAAFADATYRATERQMAHTPCRTAADVRAAVHALVHFLRDYVDVEAEPCASIVAALQSYQGADLTEAEGQILELLRNGGDGNRHIAINRWRGLPQDGGRERWSVLVYDKARSLGRGASLADALANCCIRTK